MKINYKILIILFGICFGSLGLAMTVSILDQTYFPSKGNVMMPSTLVSYMGSNVNPLLGYVFWITLIIAVIYSAFTFRQKILRLLSWFSQVWTQKYSCSKRSGLSVPKRKKDWINLVSFILYFIAGMKLKCVIWCLYSVPYVNTSWSLSAP